MKQQNPAILDEIPATYSPASAVFVNKVLLSNSFVLIYILATVVIML